MSMTVLNISDIKVLELEPFSLKIEQKVICLSGASGSGKSLLLRSVVDLIEHDGEVYLDQYKCSETNPVQWRKWLGFLPSESAWWLDSVGEHFNSTDTTYINQLNLPAECFDWDISRCSTGEKQRLAIARLLEKTPKVLLLDEPTASLDPESVLAVETLIKNYAAEFHAPVIWISHDPAQIKRVADHEFKIENNEIKEVKR